MTSAHSHSFSLFCLTRQHTCCSLWGRFCRRAPPGSQLCLPMWWAAQISRGVSMYDVSSWVIGVFSFLPGTLLSVWLRYKVRVGVCPGSSLHVVAHLIISASLQRNSNQGMFFYHTCAVTAITSAASVDIWVVWFHLWAPAVLSNTTAYFVYHILFIKEYPQNSS